ncbi:MAG: aminotransferase class III-fold pyridoxal phosphate-dependent enzyme [Hydrogenophaga sp.]|uniref:aminotransferase class III-fold pyridoxal phosphate-dependent enzyme n=1 Tax=Hydrogenophaga sp. TaxID=1904254 RepID=UPI00258066B3|nr:aminotransferase class III-fold pyridoxal phosphate-dependent enzyme [Hydrogenophaga sp.]MBL0944458.1 aminotransferase class III-fold pyridoxal phosphate-dependent enzyme [Hydrogenophaga sp.]
MSLLSYAVPAGSALLALPYLQQRLALSRAKHRSLAGHSRMAKRLARLLPGYAFDEARWFSADGADSALAAQRRAAFERLCTAYAGRYAKSLALTAQAREGLADLQLTSAYRVPFPFSPYLRERLKVGAFVQAASGVHVQDLDGNRFLDLTGSYGVNVLGVDVYKACMEEGARIGLELGPVLGALHPVVASNVQRLQAVSGHEQVSFHMSGTEAVMQAVRLARYHTRKKHLVRFCGAYHGWWEDVQPGPGNPLPPRETYTLKDMDERSLAVLRTRRDIACVLVNPLQALHPNRNAPGDGTLMNGLRSAGFDRAAYTRWLQRLREVCTERGIVLIFDEVFLGFRLAPGGAQEYFGVKADLVTYGKTVAGGYPVGVVCGRAALMQRFRPERPADLCFARGTFNAHPHVMGGMHAFFERLDTPEVQAMYADSDGRWNARCAQFNAAMAEAGLPVRARNLHSVWTLDYTQPGRYHWMFQFYLRWHGLALSWVGTGRFIFSLNFDDAAFGEVVQRCVAAGREMQADGWWTLPSGLDAKGISRQLRSETLKALFAR